MKVDMSNYIFKAKNKKTGETVDASALDNYFGGHQYGYMVDGKILREEVFETFYEEIKL